MKIQDSRLAASFLALAIVWVELLCATLVAARPHGGSGCTTNSNDQSIQVPVGTVLPAQLNHGFSSKNAQARQRIKARIMQDVPLQSGGKIPKGAKLEGTIVSVEPSTGNGVGKISFKFDQLEVRHQRIPIVVNLRALASFVEVQFAQIPETGPDFGTPSSWVTTRQIGDDEVYGKEGVVTDSWSRPVGRSTFDGVLVHVRAQPGTKCRGPLEGEDRLQALWVFASDACGVYGMPGVTIAHAGRTEPVGLVTLVAEKGDVNVRGGAGMLLRVH